MSPQMVSHVRLSTVSRQPKLLRRSQLATGLGGTNAAVVGSRPFTDPSMSNVSRRPAIAGAAVFAALVLAACSSPTDSPTVPFTAITKTLNNVGDGTGFVRVCKTGGPSGTYTFNTSVAGGGAHFINFGQGAELSLDFAGTEICLNSGSYIQLGNDPSWTAGLTGTVT